MKLHNDERTQQNEETELMKIRERNYSNAYNRVKVNNEAEVYSAIRANNTSKQNET